MVPSVGLKSSADSGLRLGELLSLGGLPILIGEGRALIGRKSGCRLGLEMR